MPHYSEDSMSRSELAKQVRRVHRERYGEVSSRHSREEAREMLDNAEAELEFPISNLVRTVFTLSGSDFVDLAFAVDRYGNRTPDGRIPDGQAKWPERMLPIKPLEDRLWLCIDCDSEGEPVYLFDDDHEIQGPGWRNRFTKVAATFEEFLQEFIDNGGEWPTRPEYDENLWVEYQGKRFRLTSACLDADDHVSEHLDPDEYSRIEQTMAEAKLASRALQK
jgi:hypothetical protein